MTILAIMVYFGGMNAADDAGWGFWRAAFWPAGVTRIIVKRIIEKAPTP